MLVGTAAGGGTEPAVAGAIRNAATATGTNFEYLLATAKVESGLNPQASAKTSSAQGLFQFIDTTWLSTLKQSGPALGYGQYAAAITQDANGQFSVADPQMRQKIMALRSDPAANAAMAGAFTRANATSLAAKLGRPASESELYMAHFLGANGASKLIALAANHPNATAASLFPRAASANRSIFYDAQGNPKSAAGVYASLSGRYDTARAGIGPAIASLQSAPPSAAVAPIAPRGNAAGVTPLSNVIAAAAANGNVDTVRAAAGLPRANFQSLFSDGRRGPVSDVVRDLWTTRPRVAAALSGVPAPQEVAATGIPSSSSVPAPVQATAPEASGAPAAPMTPAERVQNLFNDLLSSIHS
jgi:hypothetical protein